MIPKNNDMRFEVSTKCNYRCVICPHGSLTRAKETMSLEVFKKIFDRLVTETDQYETLTFPGMGEPLLDPTLEEKIAYARQRKPGIAVLILTNGSLLTLKKFKVFEALGVASIRVSLYGTDPESYGQVHGINGQEMYPRIEENLLAICRAKTITQLLLTYNVVDGKNDRVLKEWIDLWKDKVDLLEVWRPHNWVDYKKFRPLQSQMTKSCGRPFTGPLQIQVDGTVNMCCFDFDGKLTIGDLKTQTLAEIFAMPFFQKIQQCHARGLYSASGLICEHCDQRNADKSDTMIFNSKFDIKERVTQLSTTYKKVRE